jgi:hypothetical protein
MPPLPPPPPPPSHVPLPHTAWAGELSRGWQCRRTLAAMWGASYSPSHRVLLPGSRAMFTWPSFMAVATPRGLLSAGTATRRVKWISTRHVEDAMASGVHSPHTGGGARECIRAQVAAHGGGGGGEGGGHTGFALMETHTHTHVHRTWTVDPPAVHPADERGSIGVGHHRHAYLYSPGLRHSHRLSVHPLSRTAALARLRGVRRDGWVGTEGMGTVTGAASDLRGPTLAPCHAPITRSGHPGVHRPCPAHGPWHRTLWPVRLRVCTQPILKRRVPGVLRHRGVVGQEVQEPWATSPIQCTGQMVKRPIGPCPWGANRAAGTRGRGCTPACAQPSLPYPGHPPAT